MQPLSISAASQEAILALIQSKGVAYVQRQYEAGLLSAVIEPAFEQWLRTRARSRTRFRIPMTLVVTLTIVGYLALVWFA